MKKLIIIFTATLIFAATYVSAEGLYVGGNIGASHANHSSYTADNIPGTADITYNNGFLVGGVLGYDLGNHMRVDGEIAYRSSGVHKVTDPSSAFALKGDLNVWSYLINGYYDIKTNAPVTPYIGAGIGIANVEIEFQTNSVKDNTLTYQIGAGAGYAVNDTMTLDFGYKYMGPSDLVFKNNGSTIMNSINSEYSSHNLYLGLRYAIK